MEVIIITGGTTAHPAQQQPSTREHAGTSVIGGAAVITGVILTQGGTTVPHNMFLEGSRDMRLLPLSN